MIPENLQQYQGSEIIWEVLSSAGLPLDPDLRSLMEARFGRDFGRVRLHADHRAATSARALKAQAYTAGSHIVFGEGRYSPQTQESMWLLAHELVHVVQQSIELSAPPLELGNAGDLLESEADRVADLIAAGRSLPPGFAFSPAPAGLIQCHNDVPCPGTRISAAAKTIYGPANEAIEIAYKQDPNNKDHANAIFFGSQFETGRDVLLPSGAPNKKFGNLLLRRLRGISNQRRPDIIDFSSRVFYEIKSADDTRKGTVQLTSYYKVADEIRREYAAFKEPPWKVEYATWYPPHVLPLPGDPLNKIVCTQATDHKRFPGLILYDVRELGDDDKRRRGVRRAVDYELIDFEQGFAELLPTVRAELPNAVRFYDPEYPNYVVIIPQDYYRAWYKRRNDQMMEKMRVKPSYDMPGGQYVKSFRKQVYVISLIVGAMAAVVIIVAAGAVLGVAAAGAVAEGGVAIGGGAAGVGGGEVVSLAAYRAAMLAAPKVKALAAAAGVLLVLGAVKDAKAASFSVTQVSAIRAVAIWNFRPVAGLPSASSVFEPGKSNFIYTSETGSQKAFALGAPVLFDGKPHVIIGQISAE
jgi:Domain of unknown function (DUF4157)